MDALKSGNVSDGLKATDLFLNSNSGTCVSISKTDDVATLAHQLLGGKMTQVNTVV